MSGQPDFGFIKIQPAISLYFDITRGGPIPKKIREVLKARQERPEEDFERILSDVADANICTSFDYKRRGKRRLLWGLYEAEPEEKVSISVKGHFYSSASDA